MQLRLYNKNIAQKKKNKKIVNNKMKNNRLKMQYYCILEENSHAMILNKLIL